MVEIYNEAIYDMLDENDLDKDNKYLQIKSSNFINMLIDYK